MICTALGLFFFLFCGYRKTSERGESSNHFHALVLQLSVTLPSCLSERLTSLPFTATVFSRHHVLPSTLKKVLSTCQISGSSKERHQCISCHSSALAIWSASTETQPCAQTCAQQLSPCTKLHSLCSFPTEWTNAWLLAKLPVTGRWPETWTPGWLTSPNWSQVWFVHSEIPLQRQVSERRIYSLSDPQISTVFFPSND